MTTKKTEHPLEDIFDIESGSTELNLPSVRDRITEITTTESADGLYDDIDLSIESQFQEVYDTALEAYQIQADEAELVEGKYKARNQEIAVQLLQTALNAAANRSTLKTNKEKIRIAEMKTRSSGSVTNNNTIVGTTSEILKMMREAKKAEDPKIINDDD